MTRKVQTRTLATRDRLLAAGREIVAAEGMAGLRTEAVVLRAGTAKGTFFAHFTDRDQFLAALLAEALAVELGGLSAPSGRAALMALMTQVFDRFSADAETVALLARFSGPAGAGLGLDLLIGRLIERLAEGVAILQAKDAVRNRAAPEVLAEAILAAIFHAAASAQCQAQGDRSAVRGRAETLLVRMAEALLWPEI